MSNPRIPYRLSSARPPLPALKKRRILVHLVVNLEHWPFDQPMPRTIITPPHGRQSLPDVPNFAWAEYGLRAGLPRILDLFASRGVEASCSINACVVEAYPAAADAALRAGWELIGHGIHQRGIDAEAGEAELIRTALDTLEAFSGFRPRGWLSPGLRETFETPDLLKQAGLEYVCDWVVDDVPCWLTTRHGPLIAMPYTLEINDSIIYAVERQATGEMLSRLGHTLRRFEQESAHGGGARVLTIGLHPHLIGVPHRLHELEEMLDLLTACQDIVCTKGTDIARWFAEAEPPP